jgi:hypothetical protein
VNYYGSSCSNCGGWQTAGAAAAGVAVGMAVGATVANANSQAAASNAYNSGYAAGSANPAYAIGAIYPTVPAGCAQSDVGGITYYLLPIRQYVVPAIIRRERRLLSRGATSSLISD